MTLLFITFIPVFLLDCVLFMQYVLWCIRVLYNCKLAFAVGGLTDLD